MSVEFIKGKYNCDKIEQASMQQSQLLYFTRSSIQENYSKIYWENWAKTGYKSDNTFINWICSTFKESNYVKFVKHLRFPLPSATLVNNKIKPELSRVFFSEDSYSKYTILGKEFNDIDDLNTEEFEKEIFHKLLFEFNDIVITDLYDTNKPYRYFVSIDDVVAIKSNNSKIKQIAFCSSIELEGEKVLGYTYIDDDNYIFYDKEFKLEPIVRPHDLGDTPADYITSRSFGDNDVVRESLFSDLRGLFEEYVMLKTLQKMTEKNGSIPVVTKLMVEQQYDTDVQEGVTNGIDYSMSATALGATSMQAQDEHVSDKALEAGSVSEVPAIRLENGGVDMSMVENFMKFHYLPVEAMEYVNIRVKEIEVDIILMSVGDYFEANQSAQNEIQVSKSYISKEDKLRIISNEITRIVKLSNYKFLALQYGKESVSAEYFAGSDFFLETQSDIYDLIAKSPNPIESRINLIRLAKNRSRFDQDRKKRDTILYTLLPYSISKDFEMAVDKGFIDSITFQYQTRFQYWINSFETIYGDIVYFWDETEGSDAVKFDLMNKLIIDLINKFLKEQKDESSTPKSDQVVVQA